MAIREHKTGFVLIASMVSVTAWAAAGHATQSATAEPQSQAVPFTLVQVLSLESSGEVDKIVTARRSDGTLATISAALPPGYGMKGRVIAFPDGSRIAYYDAFRMKTTWPARRVAGSDYRQNFHPTTCVQAPGKVISRDHILGEEVEVIDEAIEDFHLITYQAPRLACTTLQYKVLGSHPNSASANAQSLDVGKEPQPDLFDSPDYEEVRPSEVDKRLLLAIGYSEPPDPEHVKSSREMDAMYDSLRKQK